MKGQRMRDKATRHPKRFRLQLPNQYKNVVRSSQETDVGKKKRKIRSIDTEKWPMLRDFGGVGEVIEDLKEKVLRPFYNPQLPRVLGVKPITGVLLHGPPGCGKTTLAEAIANETGVPFYRASAVEFVDPAAGKSEDKIRQLFVRANDTAPSVVFIDEIDAVATKRQGTQGRWEDRLVTQLMTCMDDSRKLVSSSSSSLSKPRGYVLVFGATNRPDALDSALRRRFELEIYLGVPDERAREGMLSVQARKYKVEGALDLAKIAKSTPGFVGADLEAVGNIAGNLAMNRVKEREVQSGDWWKQVWSDEDMGKLSITMADFEKAVKMVQPSSKREGFSDIPNVKWDDVGGLESLREEFKRHIIWPIKFPTYFEELGLKLKTGFLLYGPPGCGKTLIAKAVANEAGANFIHIKGPEILNKYIGESEAKVRSIFSRARTCSPCIIFFDEVDALAKRSDKEGGWSGYRVLQQILVELDGGEERKGVYVIGATNRPEVMDPALLRQGRFGKLVYVPLPGPDERGMILKALARGKPIDSSLDLMALGRDDACANLSGADLSALVEEAVMLSSVGDDLEDVLLSGRNCSEPCLAKEEHFRNALTNISPSVSHKQLQCYEFLSKNSKRKPGEI